jgi:hypothetical protein
MPFFQGNSRKKARIAALADLEKKRLAFAGAAQNLGLGRTLLVEHEGGFIGLTEGEDGHIYAVSGPAPGSKDDFLLRPLVNCRARIEIRYEEPEGASGYMGFGKKGGEVFGLLFLGQGSEPIFEIMPDVTCFLFSTGCPFADGRRRRNNANIVWDLRPQGRDDCIYALTYWVERDILAR